MKYINEDLLYKYIKKITIKDDIDFVAFAVFYLHAVGVIIYFVIAYFFDRCPNYGIYSFIREKIAVLRRGY